MLAQLQEHVARGVVLLEAVQRESEIEQQLIVRSTVGLCLLEMTQCRCEVAAAIGAHSSFERRHLGNGDSRRAVQEPSEPRARQRCRPHMPGQRARRQMISGGWRSPYHANEANAAQPIEARRAASSRRVQARTGRLALNWPTP